MTFHAGLTSWFHHLQYYGLVLKHRICLQNKKCRRILWSVPVSEPLTAGPLGNIADPKYSGDFVAHIYNVWNLRRVVAGVILPRIQLSLRSEVLPRGPSTEGPLSVLWVIFIIVERGDWPLPTAPEFKLHCCICLFLENKTAIPVLRGWGRSSKLELYFCLGK